MYISAVRYYICSVIAMLTHFNWWVCAPLLFKREVVITHRSGFKFHVGNVEDIIMIKEVLSDRCHEQIRKVRKHDTVVDIGAGVGDFAVAAGGRAKNIYSYENDKKKIDLMKKNMRLNNMQNVHVVAKKAPTARIILTGIDMCDFFKIDCEGCEYSVFNGFDSSDARKIHYIAMEAHRFDKEMSMRYKILLATLHQYYKNVVVIPTVAHSNVDYVYAYGHRK
jgi:hypothetical protein